MVAKHPIVLYGMSGYTGQLVAEHLTKRKVPFVAAGRNRDKIEEALRKVREMAWNPLYILASVGASVSSGLAPASTSLVIPTHCVRLAVRVQTG